MIKEPTEHMVDCLGRQLDRWDIITVSNSYGTSHLNAYIIYSFSKCGIYGVHLSLFREDTLEKALIKKNDTFNRFVYMDSTYSIYEWDNSYSSFSKRCTKIPLENLSNKERDLYTKIIHKVKKSRNEITTEKIEMKL